MTAPLGLKFLKNGLAIVICLAGGAGFASPTNSLPKFDEVYRLLRSNLNGSSEADLNRAAVQGLLAQLETTAMLVNPAADNANPSAALGKSAVYDGAFAYLRVLKVEGNLAEQLRTSYQQLSATNKSKIKGVILDLRFAGGADFAAAAAAADCFLNADQPLLEFGSGVARSTTKTNAISVPVAILINARTSEAAEALAAILRETSTGLLLGSDTAGRAHEFKEFPLTDGGGLRIAVGQIKLGDGTVFAGAVKPDIIVDSNPADEKAFWEDPFKAASRPGAVPLASSAPANTNNVTSTNTPRVFRPFNEAELVREKRDGVNLEAEFSGNGRYQPDPAIKIINDAALARALDLLKGLAVVQQGHPG